MLNMAETASDTITIAAAPDTVWAIATDIERYPEWARDVKDVVVTARDLDLPLMGQIGIREIDTQQDVIFIDG
jgi:uncharacterized protein YndB with AHSA1/START domain